MSRPKQPFRFKQFSVDDSNCSMKVGTDGVLLGAWAEINDAKRILDIGTGSGVIALMMAQRTLPTVKIDAVEVVEADYHQAVLNFRNSPWPSKIHAYHSSIQAFAADTRYDLIISNPPFFSNSYLPPSEKRKAARHTQSLSPTDLLKVVCDLLDANGWFCLILPTVEGEKFQMLALTFGLHVNKKTAFFSRQEKPQERWSLEFSFEQKPVIENSIVLYEHDDIWSEQYRLLTNEFYLDR